MARVAIRKVTKVMGIFLRRPPMSGISWLCTAWITEPAPRKSRALNMAWVVRWNMPLAASPAPRAMTM